MAPDPRNGAVGTITIVFSKPVTGLDLADLALRRNGGPNLLTGVQTPTTGDGRTWILGNLAGLTAADGTYVLGLTAAGSGIVDAAGNALAADAGDSFVVDTTPPTADILDVTPDPRDGAVGTITIVFSEPVTGFDLADLALRRNGGANLLTAAQTLTTADNVTWTLGNLAGPTGTPGSYALGLTAAGSGIVDAVGNALTADAGDAFVVVADTTPPTADVLDVAPDPRTGPVGTITVVFSEPVAGFDLADLALRRNGGANLLTAAQTLTTADNVTWTLGNLAGPTAADGTYVLGLTAAGSGIQDAGGNALAADAGDTFTITTQVAPAPPGDVTGPVLLRLSPAGAPAHHGPRPDLQRAAGPARRRTSATIPSGPPDPTAGSGTATIAPSPSARRRSARTA